MIKARKMPEKSTKKAVQTEPISNIGTKKLSSALITRKLTEKLGWPQHDITLRVIIRQIILTQTVVHKSKLSKSFRAK
jgi:hypothetical protein